MQETEGEGDVIGKSNTKSLHETLENDLTGAGTERESGAVSEFKLECLCSVYTVAFSLHRSSRKGL